MARRSRSRRSCGWPSVGGEGHAGGTFEPPGGGQPCEGRGPNRRRSGTEHLMAADGLLKISELAAQSGVSAGTIKHYLREGLLPEPIKTSRNMAYYPPDFVDRIRLIKRLQEERFMPLRHIKNV